MKKRLVFSSLCLSLFLSGCDENSVKLLKKDFLKTKVGTVDNQKLVKKIEVKKKEKLKTLVAKKINKVKKTKPITVSEKKSNFKKVLVPIVTKVYNQLEEQYSYIRKSIQTKTNQEQIENLKKIYDVDTNEKLLHAIKPHPISIVLAQAAIESAWLTSRFAKEANNIFGVWSFNKKEPRIAANGTRGTKKIYLKKYNSLEESVSDYYKSIAKSWAYPHFRYLRTVNDDPYVLVKGLTSYSEKGEEYTKLLASMIRSNKFDKFDIKVID